MSFGVELRLDSRRTFPSRCFIRAAALVVAIALVFFLWAAEAAPAYGGRTLLLKPARSKGLDLQPSNPPGRPHSPAGKSGSPGIVAISSGMFSAILPNIANLDFGFTYCIGDAVSTGSLCADYLVPISKCPSSMIFTETHMEYAGYWKSLTAGAPALVDASNRLDLSIGGGYRRTLAWDTIVGINAFYDTSRIFRNWYSSWGWGVEASCITEGDQTLDFNLNMYGMQFNRRSMINAFRNRGTSFDIQASYARPLFNKAIDWKFKLGGYQFDTGDKNYGCRIGTEITGRGGWFRFTYDFGYDAINEGYHKFGGYLNLSLNWKNLLCGKDVVSLPPPVFEDGRSIIRITTRKVERNWHQPTAVILANDAATAAAEGLAEPELMLVSSRTTSPGIVSLLAAGPSIQYSRFLGAPAWSGSAVRSDSLDRIKRVEILLYIIRSDPSAPDFTVGVRFVDPYTGATSDRMSPVSVPGNTPAGSTVVRSLDQPALKGLRNHDAQGFVRVRTGDYSGPFGYRVTVNFYR